MCQENFRKRGVGLGTEQHPISIGRKTVPGVEKLTVAFHPSGHTAGCRYNEELAVRLKHDAGFAACKDNPLSTRGKSREIVAHSIMARTFQRFRSPAVSLIEWNSVKIELYGKPLIQFMNISILDMGSDV